MRARELARPVPTLRLDDPATEVGRLLTTETADVVFLADPAGELAGVVTDTRLLWFLLPAYLHQDPGLAGVLEEAAAEALRDRLTGRTAADLLVTAHRDVPEISGDANLIEVAALLVRTRAPAAAVRDAGRLLGGITTSALLGLLRPTAGRAWLFGVDAADVRAAHRHVAFVPADVALWPRLTGAETLELLARVGPGTDLAYQAELVERFELDLDRRGQTYSTGNRQKVALVAAFATQARLLILDEPASGLDPLMERTFRHCIAEAAERGQTVLLSSHQLAEVEAVYQRVGILRRGRLVEVAGLSELRRLRRTEVDVTLAGTTFGAEQLDGLARVPGVSDVRRPEPARILLALSGPPGPALRRLAELDVAKLEVRAASLEEIFLDYYSQEDTAVASPDSSRNRAS